MVTRRNSNSLPVCLYTIDVELACVASSMYVFKDLKKGCLKCVKMKKKLLALRCMLRR